MALILERVRKQAPFKRGSVEHKSFRGLEYYIFISPHGVILSRGEAAEMKMVEVNERGSGRLKGRRWRGNYLVSPCDQG